MSTFLAELRETIAPGKHGKQGRLPQLLLAMTLVTGLVDAFSYLILGHVFVANMTGNVVLLGFALAGAPGFSIPASAAAIASFGIGALIGGHTATRPLLIALIVTAIVAAAAARLGQPEPARVHPENERSGQYPR